MRWGERVAKQGTALHRTQCICIIEFISRLCNEQLILEHMEAVFEGKMDFSPLGMGRRESWHGAF